jgi:hypothetical protein
MQRQIQHFAREVPLSCERILYEIFAAIVTSASSPYNGPRHVCDQQIDDHRKGSSMYRMQRAVASPN